MKVLRDFLMIICFISGVFLVALGRIKTFHLTEVEAFIHLWYYWVGALVCFCIGAVLFYHVIIKDID